MSIGEKRKEEYAKRVEIVRRLYPTMTGGEIARKYGWASNKANEIARKIGVKHSPETEARIFAERIKRLREGGARKEVQERRRLRWKRAYRLEELRILSGEPRQTKFNFPKLPVKVYASKYYLVNTHHYIPDENDLYALYYDENTNRRLNRKSRNGNEEYYSKKYGFKFLPLPAEEPEEETETE